MSSQLISTIVYMVFLLGIFYVMFYFPEKRSKIHHKKLLDSLSVNEKIITKSGIVGIVVAIDNNEITIETGPDKVKIQLVKTSVSKILK